MKYQIREVRNKFCVEMEVDEIKYIQTQRWFWSDAEFESVKTGNKVFEELNESGYEGEPYFYDSLVTATNAAKKFMAWDKKGTVIHEVK